MCITGTGTLISRCASIIVPVPMIHGGEEGGGGEGGFGFEAALEDGLFQLVAVLRGEFGGGGGGEACGDVEGAEDGVLVVADEVAGVLHLAHAVVVGLGGGEDVDGVAWWVRMPSMSSIIICSSWSVIAVVVCIDPAENRRERWLLMQEINCTDKGNGFCGNGWDTGGRLDSSRVADGAENVKYTKVRTFWIENLQLLDVFILTL